MSKLYDVYAKKNGAWIRKGSTGGGTSESAIPPEIETEGDMNALIDTGEVGGVYRYVGESGTYENGALYFVENIKLINFSVDNETKFVECIAEEGMTWSEWVDSKYNSNTFFSTNEKLAIMDNGSPSIGSPYLVYIHDTDLNMIEGNELIIDGYRYYLYGK